MGTHHARRDRGAAGADLSERMGQEDSRSSSWRAASIARRSCRIPACRGSWNRWSSSGRSTRSSRCRSCSRGCSIRCRRRSNAPIAAPRRCGSICGSSIGRRTRACCSCRPRCAIAKVLRTLLLLDLESHPPSAAIDIVTIEIDPAPGRIVQYSLLERAMPSPETLATLTARLGALVGETPLRLAGAPRHAGVPMDSRCGGFAPDSTQQPAVPAASPTATRRAASAANRDCLDPAPRSVRRSPCA